MRAIGLNHVSIHAEDLEASVRFYEDFFGLERIPTPDFGYPVQWLRLGDRQLHIFVRDTPAPEHHHFSLDVDDYEAAFLKAKERGCYEYGPRRFPDGSVQFYVRDPAGNRIELDWPDWRTLSPKLFGEIPAVAGPSEASVYLREVVREVRVPGLAEPVSHYTDAVRAGNTIYISGVVSSDAEGKVVGKGDVVAQARQVFKTMGRVLEAAGARPRDVVKVTIFMRDATQRPLINPVRQEFFGSHRPASTLVEISRLVHEDYLLEIEAVAVIGG